MKYKFLGLIIAVALIGCYSCQKEPKKGEYKGVFKGRYETDTSSTTYTTNYYFNVTHSTKKELRLQEKQSKITSVLKKYDKDSISGSIGFGGIYNPDGDISVGFSFITITGRYDKETITGSFSTTFGDKNKEYLSEGNFIISAY